MPDNKCAHQACQCQVAAGQRYCSTSCEQQARQQASSGGTQAGAQCNCGHPACRHG